MFRVENEVSTTLDAALSNASTSMTLPSPDANLFPSQSELNSGNTHICIAVLEDGGVTQANPEFVLLQGAASATLLVAKKRGFLGTSIPASWPIGTNVHLYNLAEHFNMMGSNVLAYTFFVEGHINSATPGAPAANSMRFYANGSALPSAVDNITVDVDPGGWDLSNFLAKFTTGDMVRIRWLYFDVNVGAPTTAGGSLGYNEHRFEADLSGAPVDNTSWWRLPISNASAQFHADIPNSSAGIQGLVLFDMVKVV